MTANAKKEKLQAYLYASEKPDAEQEKRFCTFLKNQYGEDIELVFREDATVDAGFRLEVGSKVYDWSTEGRFHQFKHRLKHLTADENIIPLLKETVKNWVPEAMAEELGTVLTVGDGIATVSGLEKATYGEILLFSGGIRGMVQDLDDGTVGCILFGDDEAVSAGSTVRRTGRTAGIPVGENMLGRVVNALGAPIDGKGKIETDFFNPMEKAAPGIIDRQSVNSPIETGILAIDSMFPIGKGQRELIIGDRQTGKTAIAIDTIVNQKNKNVICIYVAIGQKDSSVAKLRGTLQKRGAMDYTVIVNAGASEPAPLLYLAPYAGCAIGEYFMEQGKDVLIVYDDLSKHAVAYRTISLLLERSPGREAYPGDVFYLHSRLLERSAHLSEKKGGGSMTALPIVETQSGDVSAYIPTNIISITDGQIFLESELFFAGQRPAINVGLSVSRVGSDAQYKSVKKASGALRLSLAQYREMEVFTQFSSDLDETTKKQLRFGAGLMQLLKQEQYSPLRPHEQVILLVAALSHIMQDVDPEEMQTVAKNMLAYFHDHAHSLCRHLEINGDMTDSDKAKIVETAKAYMETLKG